MDLSPLTDLAVNVLGGFILFVGGLVASGIIHYVRNRRGRRFWGRLRRGDSVLFLGSLGYFPRDKEVEPTGLVGLGDMRAVHELTEQLAGLGITFEIADGDRIIDGQLDKNLIIVGSDDVNSVTEAVLQHVGTNFTFRSRPLALQDTQAHVSYRPTWVSPIASESAPSSSVENPTIDVPSLRTDYGIVVRTTSPFNSNRSIVLVGGVYGFGTWAGARLLKRKDFLERTRDVADFECSYRVDLISGVQARTTILQLRALAPVDLAAVWAAEDRP